MATLTALSFYCLHNISTLNQSRKPSCVIFVCKNLVRFFKKLVRNLNTPQNNSASWGLQMGLNSTFEGLIRRPVLDGKCLQRGKISRVPYRSVIGRYHCTTITTRRTYYCGLCTPCHASISNYLLTRDIFSRGQFVFRINTDDRPHKFCSVRETVVR